MSRKKRGTGLVGVLVSLGLMAVVALCVVKLVSLKWYSEQVNSVINDKMYTMNAISNIRGYIQNNDVIRTGVSQIASMVVTNRVVVGDTVNFDLKSQYGGVYHLTITQRRSVPGNFSILTYNCSGEVLSDCTGISRINLTGDTTFVICDWDSSKNYGLFCTKNGFNLNVKYQRTLTINVNKKTGLEITPEDMLLYDAEQIKVQKYIDEFPGSVYNKPIAWSLKGTAGWDAYIATAPEYLWKYDKDYKDHEKANNNWLDSCDMSVVPISVNVKRNYDSSTTGNIDIIETKNIESKSNIRNGSCVMSYRLVCPDSSVFEGGVIR